MTENDERTTGAPDEVAPEETERSWPPGERTPQPDVAPGEKTAEERVGQLEAEKQEMRDRMLRIAAEFENYKKRARREQADAESKGKEQVLRDMLEVIDNLERATAAVGEVADPKGIVQGVTLVLRLFQSKLERYDVKAIEAKGQPFDPRVHDAISRVPSADVPPGTVISELQRGYRIGERLLRPATVVVAVAPPPPAPEAADGARGDAAASADAAEAAPAAPDGEPGAGGSGEA